MKAVILILCFTSVAFGGIFLGGRVKTTPEDIANFDNIRNALVEQYNTKFRNKNLFAVIVTKIEKQTVHGTNYFLEFMAIATECKNKKWNFHRTLGVGHNKCKPTNKIPPQRCVAVVWDKAWLANGTKVTKMSCIPEVTTVLLHRSARSVSTKEEHEKIGSFADFAAFKAKHGRVYSSPAEELMRYQIFRENMKKAHVLNAIELGSGVYGHSPFADMSEEEFRRTHLTSYWDLNNMPKTMAKPVLTAPPAAFDWREHGAVTEVKNQGSCGSCWAFSTTGNIEGQWAIKKKSLISLSEQELVDCDHVDQGCNGGLPSNAYKVIQKLGGLETESAYPYEGRNDQCKFKKNLSRVYINGSVSLPTDEGKMAAWLAASGPISIGINANAMQFYFGGISHPWSIFCNPSKLDHGVLIVGYGVKGSEPFWIVKNSWGPAWGEKGYYLVYRGSGVCGLNRMPTSAVVN